MPLTVATYDPAKLAASFRSRMSARDPRRPILNVLLKAPADSRYAPGLYTLGLEDVNTGPGAATLDGSRYLAILNGVAAAAEVYVDGSQSRIASVTAGPPVNRAIDAIWAARRRPEVREAEYELHAFRIPGILMEAYWLKAGGDSDLFIPFLTAGTPLNPGEPYRWQEFWKGILDTAEMHMDFDNDMQKKDSPQEPRR